MSTATLSTGHTRDAMNPQVPPTNDIIRPQDRYQAPQLIPGGEINISRILDLEAEIREHEIAMRKLKRARRSLLDNPAFPPQSKQSGADSPLSTPDEVIREHKQHIIGLKRIQNSLLNVSRLPPEILGRIFWWSAVPEEVKEGPHSFLLVCHYWYEVATCTPELWCFWGRTLRSWTKQHHRFPQTPLDLVLDRGEPGGGDLDARVENALRDRASRDTIRSVRLKSSDSGLLHSIICALTGDQRELRRRSLESFTLQPEGVKWVDASEFFIYNRFPKLRRLDLTDCMISPWHYICSHTTSLTTLNFHLSVPPAIPVGPQILSLLTSNPTLQKLTLTGVSFLAYDWNESQPRVLLPHLNELDLAGEAVCISYVLLDRLDHPDVMGHVGITLTSCPVGGIWNVIGPYLRDHLRHRGPSEKNLGLYTSSKGGVITLRVGDVGGLHLATHVLQRMVPFLSIIVNTQDINPENLPDEIILGLIGHTPKEEVVYLQIDDDPVAPIGVYALLSNLESLHSRGILLPAVVPNPYQGNEARLLPHLRRVSFERPGVSNWGTGWTSLTTFLSFRMSSGNRLDFLEVTTSTYMPTWVEEEIRSSVGEFRIIHLDR